MSTKFPNKQRTVPTELAALAVGVSEATIRKWASRGKIARYGSPRKAEYDLAELIEIAAAAEHGRSGARKPKTPKELAVVVDGDGVGSADPGKSCPGAGADPGVSVSRTRLLSTWSPGDGGYPQPCHEQPEILTCGFCAAGGR